MTPAFFRLIRYEDHALLFLRLALGSMISFHGWPYFIGGAEKWADLGRAIAVLGITVHYPVWGFLAAISLFFGGLFLAVGLFTRLWSLSIAFTFYVGTMVHFGNGQGLTGAAHPLELAIVFATMVILGGGRFSLDNKLFG